ncbi:hypothetical protein BDDG_03886 [Blastomyces dermatitidis ATCC 18188]|uniref:Uncharacterized protein n=1 Tax=Ajellomyces dermatitidis (strain ATCC 18188 / CBS 674.68) TaxID=653446 RepID=F2TCI2_AJEDA|nr:hypothetical protein BDDG_03886 [Blastomyces dermatitidis ATCC 18188]
MTPNARRRSFSATTSSSHLDERNRDGSLKVKAFMKYFHSCRPRLDLPQPGQGGMGLHAHPHHHHHHHLRIVERKPHWRSRYQLKPLLRAKAWGQDKAILG